MPSETATSAKQTVGNYDLLDKIADGGMGSVFKARHRDSGEIVAIKLLATHMATNPTYLQRFEKEYTTAKELNHPNIVRAIEQGVAAARPYLVMEFVEGESLGQRLERDGKMPEAEAIRIMVLAAQGLTRAHKQGLIHRDVKPDNIMLTPEGGVKLADFGLVKEVDGDLNLTRTCRGLGTPHFMAPEQFRNAKNADVRCDIYSMGATLYMMVTGQMPFAACAPLDAWMKKVNNQLTPAKKLVSSLSDRINWVIRKSMDADPDKRYGSCREFVEDLTGKGTRRILPVTIDEPKEPWWYLQYKDEEGKSHLVKGKVSAIRRSIQEGRLGDASNVVLSRTKTGTYSSLHDYPEFSDLLAAQVAEAVERPDTPISLPRLPSTPTDGGFDVPADTQDTLVSSSGLMPHIRFETSNSQAPSMRKTIFWVGVGVGIGVATALLFAKW
jgi:serine/threonine protein kinase